jgi:tRNA(fMet)-specific endonuclease VapC
VKYLLDTNICIFLVKRKPVSVLLRFEQQSPQDISISTVTLAELRYGADKSSRPRQNHAALDAFLVPLSVLDFDSEAADRYGQVRADLERQGTPIGPLDTMIAAHALRLGAALVTNNSSEFSRVAGLNVEDWTVT